MLRPGPLEKPAKRLLLYGLQQRITCLKKDFLKNRLLKQLTRGVFLWLILRTQRQKVQRRMQESPMAFLPRFLNHQKSTCLKRSLQRQHEPPARRELSKPGARDPVSTGRHDDAVERSAGRIAESAIASVNLHWANYFV